MKENKNKFKSFNNNNCCCDTDNDCYCNLYVKK